MTVRAVESWTLQPLTGYVHEAGARLVLLMTPAGQVLAQFGFTRAVDNHQGQRHGIFLSGLTTGRGPLVVLAVYDLDVSSLGLVQLFFEQLVTDLRAASPREGVPKQVLAADFERELNESLSTLFGR